MVTEVVLEVPQPPTSPVRGRIQGVSERALWIWITLGSARSWEAKWLSARGVACHDADGRLFQHEPRLSHPHRDNGDSPQIGVGALDGFQYLLLANLRGFPVRISMYEDHVDGCCQRNNCPDLSSHVPAWWIGQPSQIGPGDLKHYSEVGRDGLNVIGEW